MIKLDDDLLRELGLSDLPEDEKKKLLAHIYETLEMRVGMKLAERMTDAQLTEFEQFINANDEAGALRWLEGNFPNYRDVVAAEFDNLKAEIARIAPQILAADRQQQPIAPNNPPAPGQQMWPGDQSRMQGYNDPWAAQGGQQPSQPGQPPQY